MRHLGSLIGAVLLAAWIAVPAQANDTAEVEGCAGCHYGAGAFVMPFTAGTWLASEHNNQASDEAPERFQNTYCAQCHSPFEADPAATHSANVVVSADEWQAVTCASCHPPHSLRVEWGTPIGNYDIAAETWTPVYEEEADDLCVYCHTGTRHSRDFNAYGAIMHKKGVRCMDCHLPKVPNPLDPGRMTRSHTFGVMENLPYSCINEACHDNKTEEWAFKQIEKDKLHGKDK